MKSIAIVAALFYCGNAYAQAPDIHVTPHKDRLAEYARIEKLGYTLCYEYEVPDAKAEIDAESQWRTRFEYGNKGLLTTTVEYDGISEDSTYTDFGYMPDLQPRIRRVSGEYAYNMGYLYRNGRLDTIVIAGGESRDLIAVYASNGTIKEFIVRMADVARDENGEMIEPAKIIHIPYEKYFFTYDKNKRPIEEKRVSDDSGLQFTRKFTYDAKGRIVKITFQHTNGSPWDETFSYGSNGDLILRVEADPLGERPRYYKYVYKK